MSGKMKLRASQSQPVDENISEIAPEIPQIPWSKTKLEPLSNQPTILGGRKAMQPTKLGGLSKHSLKITTIANLDLFLNVALHSGITTFTSPTGRTLTTN